MLQGTEYHSHTVTPEACDLACAISHLVGVAVKAVREEVILVRF